MVPVGKRHDSYVLKESNLEDRIRVLTKTHQIPIESRWMAHGDKAYQRSLFVVQAFKDSANPAKLRINDRMNSTWICVEWGFTKLGNLFRFTRDSKNHKKI